MPGRKEIERRVMEEASKHKPSCTCRTCRAADGDDEAMQSLMKDLI